MSATATGTRTKLRLTHGESTARTWELVGASAQTTLTIGAGADCNWVVHADGVRARHFSLTWDGALLRAADLGGAGGVTIDGEALGTGWRDVGERAHIHFGSAAITVESVRLAEPEGHPLDGAGFGVLSGNVRAERPSQRAQPPVGQVVTASASQSSASPSSLMRKATLVGVAPITAESPASGRSSSIPPGDGFRVLRPSESAEKARRTSSAPPTAADTAPMIEATVTTTPMPARPDSLPEPAVSVATPASEAPASVVEVVAAEVVPAPGPSPAKVAAMRSGTLIGVAVPDIVASLRNKRPGGFDEDQRTIHGYVPPSESAPAAPHPAVVARSGTLIQVLDPRQAGSASDATQRIGSAWQESPTGDPSQFGRESRPSGVLDSQPGLRPGEGGRGAETWPMRDSAPAGRASDPNITGQYASRTPTRTFPWRYLGIAMLTVVAYFAWLYLLDHL